MGMKHRWFRRRPSDDEMREELEAHVAMRAEHDGVNEVAARRRLGNVLQTREEMRRLLSLMVGELSRQRLPERRLLELQNPPEAEDRLAAHRESITLRLLADR